MPINRQSGGNHKKMGLARDSPQRTFLSPVNVRKRQSYTKVESGNNGIKKMVESKMKLVDTIIDAAPHIRDLCLDQS